MGFASTDQPQGCIVPRLIVIKGADEGKHLELTAEMLSIGRDPSNRIRLQDTEVSRKHAEVVRTPDGYRLKDIGSANGTYVNNRAIHDVLLQSGDQIQIGQSLLLFTAGRSEPGSGDLAQHINLIVRKDLELSSAIVGTIGETEGSRILTRPEKADVPFLRANLGILYEAIQAVSHILDVDQLLDRILELIFRALDADRGCILLRETTHDASALPPLTEGGRQDEPLKSADFLPRAVRWHEGATREDQISVSRTMIDHVLEHRQGLLVNDASRDERFHAAQSIVRSGVREIICVPMAGR